MGKLSKDQLPQPYLLEDFYLAKMAGLDVKLPDPLYTSDYYLKYIAENKNIGGGTGLTEEQEAEIAKISTIETNVSSNTASISTNATNIASLTTRVTQVENSGVSDEVISQKITDYIAENGVLTDGCVQPEHLSTDLIDNTYKVSTSVQYEGLQFKSDSIINVTSKVKYSFRLKAYTDLTTITAKFKYGNYELFNTFSGVLAGEEKAYTFEHDVTEKQATNTKISLIHLMYNASDATKTTRVWEIKDLKVYVDDEEITDVYNFDQKIEGVTIENVTPKNYKIVDKKGFDEKIEFETGLIDDKLESYSDQTKYLFNATSPTGYSKIDIFKTNITVRPEDILHIEFDAKLDYSDDTKSFLDYRENVCIMEFVRSDNSTPKSFVLKSKKYTTVNNQHFSDTISLTSTSYIKTVRMNFNGTIKAEISNLVVTLNGNRINLINYIVESENFTVLEENNGNKQFATVEYVNNLIDKDNTSYKPKINLPFPDNIYTVDSSKNLKYLPIFIDYLYGRFAMRDEERILFENGEDRVYIEPSSTDKIKSTKVEFNFNSEFYDVAPVTFNKITVPEAYKVDDLRVLCIGDSVTAGAITRQQYWSYAADLFAKEDLIRNRTSKVMFLGNCNTRKTTVTHDSNSKETIACACGVSSWNLQNWLTSDNDGKPNGFCYTDSDGNKQFSILKWIERFRNYDDEGNKLQLGDSNLGSMITESNIDTIKCCTPNVIYINSTHNENMARTIEDHETIVNKIREELPDCKIIIGAPMPLAGSWWIKEKYTSKDWLPYLLDQPNGGGQGDQIKKRSLLLNWALEKARTNDWLYALPQIVITPTIEALEYDEIDFGIKTMKRCTTQPMAAIHPGTKCHQIWGYELYSILKYISAKNQGLETSIVTATLDNTTASIEVNGTIQLTGTASDGKSAITYSSSDGTIATVDSNGLVTGVAAGTCYIYANTSTSDKPATCNVTVTA